MIEIILASLVIFAVGATFGLLVPRRSAGWDLRVGATPDVLRECTIAHGRGDVSVRIPLRTAFRICGVELPDHELNPLPAGRRLILQRVTRQRLQAIAEEVQGIGEAHPELAFFAREAMAYIDRLEDERPARMGRPPWDAAE